MTSTQLVLPDGRSVSEVYKAEADGKGKIVGLSPWKESFIQGRGLIKGASTKKARWQDYYDMYKGHAIVRAAIDKIAKAATNAGYDFVPRDTRLDPNEREVKILKNFFDQQTNFISVLGQIYVDLLIYGDAYLYVVPNRRRKPARLKRLHPKTMHISVKTNGHVSAYFQKDPDDISDSVVRFEPQEILHFKLTDPDNDIFGLSPLESLRWAVAADLYAQRYNASFFMNSGVTGTIIGIRNANPDEVQRNRKWLEDNYVGPDSAHKPIIIEGESVSISKSVATHTEMGFLEGRKFIILEILAVLDVPPAKIGIMESANRSNSKEQDKTFRTESVSPLQRYVETIISDKFIRDILGVKETVFVHSEGDTRDAIELMNYYTKGEAFGIFSPNEIRSKLGMSNVEGGEVHFIQTPTGAVPLDRMQLYFTLPQPNLEVPPHPSDPQEGEPLPSATPESSVTTAVSRVAVKSFNEDDSALALQGAIIKLTKNQMTDSDLRQAYSYLVDASVVKDSRISHALKSVQQACLSKDEFLRLGYIERAQEALSSFLQPLENDEKEEGETYDE